jgi:hypothetical protein
MKARDGLLTATSVRDVLLAKTLARSAARFLTLACVFVIYVVTVPVAAAETADARVESYLRESGFDYKRVKENSWYINKTGKQLANIRVLLGASSSSISVGAVVVPKQNLRVTADSMYKMMQLSYDFNFVRICIDPDEDLLVMSQVKMRLLDLQEFKDTIERVAAAADRAYGEVRPFLVSSE